MNESAPEILLGVDLGTSAVKVVAFNKKGEAQVGVSREYELLTPKPNWAEQHPEDWWKATASALRSITKKIDPETIQGVSFSGQMHGSVFLDRNQEVIRPALLWCDGRTEAQCRAIIETIGRKDWLATIKNMPLTSFTLPKLMWLRDHEKKNFNRLRTVLLPKDYIRMRLVGNCCMDEADGAGTVMMEVGKKKWANRLLEKLGLSPDVLPPLMHSTDVVGTVSAEAAQQTGLRAGMLVVAGGGDQPVGAVGAGVFREGQAMVSLGTSGVVFAPTTEARVADGDGLASFDHCVPGTAYLMGCVLMAGGALRWYRDTLCEAEIAEARRRGVDPYEIILGEAEKAPIGAEGLLFTPYLMGERTPHANPGARGSFVGLSVRHTKAHMTRAVIEGISYALRDGLEAIRRRGVVVEEIRATGGGARSHWWLQVLADVLGVPVRPVESEEGPALGAAILAGVGTGLYKDFEEAERLAIKSGRVIKPAPKRAEAYEAAYRRYVKVYPSQGDLFDPQG